MSMQRGSASLMGDWTAGAKIRAESAEAKLAQVRADLMEVQAACEKLHSTNAALGEARQQVQVMEKAVAQLRIALKSSELRLSEQSYRAAADLAAAQTEAETLTQQLAAKEEELTDISEKLAALSEECSSAKAGCSALQAEKIQLEAQLAQAAAAREHSEHLRQENMQLGLQVERTAQQLTSAQENRYLTGFIPYMVKVYCMNEVVFATNIARQT